MTGSRVLAESCVCGAPLLAHRLRRVQIKCAEVAERAAQARPSHAEQAQGYPEIPDERIQVIRDRIAEIRSER